MVDGEQLVNQVFPRSESIVSLPLLHRVLKCDSDITDEVYRKFTDQL